MKTRTILYLLGVILAAVLFIVVWPWEDKSDLGQLELAQLDPGNTYCPYEITVSDCENPGYAIGDIICIECCVNDPKPWPPKAGPNNNCPKTIVFTSADGTCEYEAKRTGAVCTICPNNHKGVYKCPN